MSDTDTIFALSTPPAKSGLAVIRLSGRHALAALERLSKLKSVHPRHAHYASFFDPATGELIDKGLAIFFKAPASFTGEDIVELHMHGSIAAIRQMQTILAGMEGLRPALAGEFSRRAFLNGKMDLMEAEGMADLIDSETSQQKSQALRQMEGKLSGFYDTLREDIISCLAHLEAYIDFPDEEIPESVLTGLSSQISDAQELIRKTLSDGKRGERVRDGITIAILGAPNVGKSSLLNTLAQREVAIVSQRAGTTRDIIEVHLDIAGYPVVLVDTAGIRASDDEIEQEGIRRAMARAGDADLKLVLFDGANWPSVDTKTIELIDGNSIAVVNKSDLMGEGAKKQNTSIPNPLFISTENGEGLEQLLAKVESHIIHAFSNLGGSFITRQRHRGLLEACLGSLEKAKSPLPLELKCEELRVAGQHIGKITGKIQVDDVLDVIFKRFCIGK